MGHPELVQGTRRWYLVVQEGESVMRVLSGMRLGETASGDLSFETSCAQLKLDVADDGDLLVSAVADRELESSEGIRSHRQRLSRDRLAEIRLPHHVLKLTTKLTDMNEAQETTQVRAVRSTDSGAQGEKGREEGKTPKDGTDNAVRKPFRGSSRRMLPDRIVPADVAPVEPKPDSVPTPTPPPPPPPPTSQLTPPKPPAPAPATRKTPKRSAKQTAKPTLNQTSKLPPKSIQTAKPTLKQAPKQTPKLTPIQAQRRVQPVGRAVASSAANRRAERIEHSDATRRRYILASLAALIGLAVIGFALLYPAPPDEPLPESAATVDAGRAVPETLSADTGNPGPETDASPSAGPFQPPAIDPVVVEMSEPAPEPAAAEPSQPAPDPIVVEIFEAVPQPAPAVAEVSEPIPDPVAVEIFELVPDPVVAEVLEPTPDPVVAEVLEPTPDPVVADMIEPVSDPVAAEAAEPIPDPVASVSVERPQTSQIATTVGVTEAGLDEQTVDNRPDASVATELEQIQETTQALEAELARRDLLAAGLALELGRLVEPAQESAYTLYNRVLTRYPDSPEAKAGVQSVRQGLINRTLAQLAGNDLDSARRSLQAAEDAGVNPQLIADLRGEILYRQQLTGEQ